MSMDHLLRNRINRRRALGLLGALGAAPFVARSLRGGVAHAAPTQIVNGTTCVLTPSLTEGPYFVDERLNRSDLTSNTTNTGVVNGLPLTLNISLNSIKGAGCRPVGGVQVDVWHASAIGQYSDEPAGMGQANTQGQTWLRGYQTSDANGNVAFKIVYPGWYSGRTIHIHVKVRTFNAAGNTTYEFNSQLFFNEATNDLVMARSTYNARGTRDTRNAQDNIYGNNTSLLVDLAPMPDGTAGYVATAALGLNLDPTTAAAEINQKGLSGLWYDPSTSGQGFGLEIFPDMTTVGQGIAFGTWFTYDASAAGGVEKQRWYTFSGPAIAGVPTATAQIYENDGGNFNAPPITSAQAVGSATLNFTSCARGQLTYAFSDGSGREGIIPLRRLTPNVICSTAGTPATNADFALSGNWYDPSTAGQGFVFEINPNSPVCFFAWYTYAPNGQSIGGAASQRWYTAQTSYSAGARSFTMPLFQTTGGIFDTPTVPLPSTQSANVGTATMVFASCTNATLTYNFSAGANAGHAGTIALTRVGPTPAGCVT